MKKAVIFSGTSEGRRLSEMFCAHRIPHTVCVATEYGKAVMTPDPLADVRVGRLTKEEMTDFFCETQTGIVFDATHPFAKEATANIREAADVTGVRYVRIRRSGGEETENGSAVKFFNDTEACIRALNETEGGILLTTGSKELPEYARIRDFADRVYARVLPIGDSIEVCREAGLPAAHILAMQGPFSQELNEALIRQFGIRTLVTKETGRSGGYDEKVNAAGSCGINCFVIGKSEEADGITVDEAFMEMTGTIRSLKASAVQKKAPEPEDAGPAMTVSLIGYGPGDEAYLTAQAEQAVGEAEIVFGASRLIDNIKNKKTYSYYLAKDIIPVLEKERPSRAAVLFTGDVSFYSGALKMKQALDAWNAAGLTVRLYPGISSLAYFAAAIGGPYAEAGIYSVHGKDERELTHGKWITSVRYRERTFLLLSGAKDVRRIAEVLTGKGLGDCRIFLGYQLSYPNEAIRELSVEECLTVEEEGLYIAMIRQPEPGKRALLPVIGDEEFIRRKVPMTKAMIRHASILHLKLTEDSIVYDIGSGTGSVAVEIAKLDDSVHVYAIEKKPEAAALIRENTEKFHCGNVTVIEGGAPEAMEGLETPTHTFIGGSSGNLKEILLCLKEKNPRVRIVINAISLETMAEIAGLLKELPVKDVLIQQLSVANSREIGSYHLMSGENPILIAAFEWETDE